MADGSARSWDEVLVRWAPNCRLIRFLSLGWVIRGRAVATCTDPPTRFVGAPIARACL